MRSQHTIVIYVTVLVYLQISERNIYEDHGGADSWPNIYKNCGGKRQSPIDLSSAASISLPPLKVCERYSKVPQSIHVSTGHHTIFIVVSLENDEKIEVEGGPLSDTYALAQVHFHWGDEDSIGSEHSINGTFYALEVHTTHYNMKYGSMADAQTQPNGLLVIGFLFKVVETTTSSAMDELANAVKKLQQKGVKTAKVPNPFPLEKLLPRFHGGYFTYPGSLTTPPCHETVTWIVKGTPLEISSANMAIFRGLYNAQPKMRNNIRPLQPLNDRKIAFVASEEKW